PHRTAVDVQAARAGGHLQPQAAPVHAELRQQRALHVVADAGDAAGLPDQAVHARGQRMVGLLAVAEMEAQFRHAWQTSKDVTFCACRARADSQGAASCPGSTSSIPTRSPRTRSGRSWTTWPRACNPATAWSRAGRTAR